MLLRDLVWIFLYWVFMLMFDFFFLMNEYNLLLKSFLYVDKKKKWWKFNKLWIIRGFCICIYEFLEMSMNDDDFCYWYLWKIKLVIIFYKSII